MTFRSEMTEDEQNTAIIDFFSSAALYLSIEQDTESEIGRHYKVMISSDFLEQGESTYYGATLHNALMTAARFWHRQCLQQAQVLESTIKKLKIWVPLKDTVYDGVKHG